MGEILGFTVLTCPVCATTVDAEVPSVPAVREFTCTSCESFFSVIVDPAKVRAHGHVG